VLAAKARRFEIRLIYVILRSADLNVERVRIRVADGGHRVAKRKIIERRERSLQQPWFLEHADGAWIFDNSGSKPHRIGTKITGHITLDSAALPEIRKAVEQVGTRRKMPLLRS
jgi:predicted ABC-type ATPase